MDVDIAAHLAKTFQDYGIYAVTSLAVFAIVFLFRALRKTEREKFDVAVKLAPLVERLTEMLERAAQARAARKKEKGEEE